jgi:hypothetical protein
MTLGCTMKSGAKQDVVVVFDPPLAGYEEVKPRLLEMKAIAQEGLGMVGTCLPYSPGSMYYSSWLIHEKL